MFYCCRTSLSPLRTLLSDLLKRSSPKRSAEQTQVSSATHSEGQPGLWNSFTSFTCSSSLYICPCNSLISSSTLLVSLLLAAKTSSFRGLLETANKISLLTWIWWRKGSHKSSRFFLFFHYRDFDCFPESPRDVTGAASSPAAAPAALREQRPRGAPGKRCQQLSWTSTHPAASCTYMTNSHRKSGLKDPRPSPKAISENRNQVGGRQAVLFPNLLGVKEKHRKKLTSTYWLYF